MRTPLVSVVLPVFNAEETVGMAIQSLLRQTYSHLEIVIINDGSTDASAAVISQISDARIRVLQQDHQGLVPALRLGCAEARGEYLVRLDADDFAHPRRVAAQVDYLEKHPEVGLLGTWARIEHVGAAAQIFAPPADDLALRRYLVRDNPFVHSSVMVRRVALEEAGGYSTGANEDYRLWIRIARSWKLAIFTEALVAHRVRGTSLSRQAGRRAALRARLRCQWEAASILGPWYAALPALAATAAVYLVTFTGAGVEARLQQLASAAAARSRGFRGSTPEQVDDWNGWRPGA